MKRLFTLLIIQVFCCSTVYPQVFNIESNKSVSKSTKDWSYTIDTTWGPGLSTAQKLDFFDNWWYRVDQTWGGFPNLIINWDSLKNYYRPIIEAGVSRGRYMGIMSRLLNALNEEHASVVDPNVDIIYGIYYDQYGQSIEYPNYPSFNYKAGIPLLNLTYHFRTNFGAGLTAYNDSIALVYSVMPNHPLNLQPGDIILGYDGLPWKQNLKDLIDQELPLLFGGPSASSQETLSHVKVLSAGMNWGLFDTIDILKYSTGDTLHYPTSLLSSISQPYFIATEQLSINGVPFPNISANNVVSWGVVDGTSIGYIHVWNWYTGNVTALFEQAVDELMHLHNVTGLILDFRVNTGGYPSYANGGFIHLFNEDPTSNFSTAQRIPGDDHFLFDLLPTGTFINNFNPTPELFDHPIAVLIGPICASAGDMNAFRMRFHPMARFFGKKSMGAFTSYDNWQNIYYSAYDYKSRVDNGCMYSNYNNEGFLIHKGSPVDEEVWLTRDGVANGQDDVVNRALEWINNVVYPHDIISDETYYSAGGDTVEISTMIENPNQHLIEARAYINNFDGVVIDSIDLTKQLLKANAENWKGNIIAPATEDFFKISVKTFDQTAADSFTLPNATRFTTAGPVVLDSIYITYNSIFKAYYVKLFLKNEGSTFTIPISTVQLSSNDTWITSISSPLNISEMLPGSIVSSGNFYVRVDSTFQEEFNFNFLVSIDGWPYWTDSAQIIVTGIEDEIQVPLTFRLEQNYPNPFNPSTTFRYSLPYASKVTIKIFGVLGKEIETLVNEEKPSGTYELTWNTVNLPSGVYFYQMKAGEYSAVKKMLLLK